MAGKLVSLFVVGLLAACSVPMQLPSEFLVLHGRSRAGDFAAVTGDDARLWMRQFVEPSGGDLTFWSQVLRKDFEDRGYRLVADGECVDAAGVTGRWIEAQVDLDGELGGYLCAVWVADRSWWQPGVEVTTVEFAARAETFAARRDAVVAALASVRR